MTEFLKTLTNFSLPFENTMKTHLTDLLYLFDDRPPSVFSLYLGVYFLTIHFTKLKLMGGSIPVLNPPKKYILFTYPIPVLSYLL